MHLEAAKRTEAVGARRGRAGRNGQGPIHQGRPKKTLVTTVTSDE